MVGWSRRITAVNNAIRPAQKGTGTFMITGKLKSTLDKLWLEFFCGGITNPLTVIEQISFLMFARLIEHTEERNKKKAKVRGRKKGVSKAYKSIIPNNQSHLRWSNLVNVGAEELMHLLNGSPTGDEQAGRSRKDPWMNLFQFYRSGLNTGDTNKTGTLGSIATFFKDAQCMINKPSLAAIAVATINDLPTQEADTKGDLYEYMLSKLSTAGVAGQFRTPRQIIKAMVEIVDPEPKDTICDPACGTGGFLTQTMEYLKQKHTTSGLEVLEKDDDGNAVLDDHGNEVYHYPGDLLHRYQSHMDNDMFHGFDFDATMLRIAAMNMLLHGIDSPCIEYKDTLSEQANIPKDYEKKFNVVLANPPFKGSIDGDAIHKSLSSVVKTKKTELLFLVLMEKILITGGKCAVIVPDGVLFGSSKAHKAVRELLVEKNQIEAVISLPSGVFKPYAGVSTAILIFTKEGQTDNVFFYKVEADGYSLDDKRTPVKENDLPDLVKNWRRWEKVCEGTKAKLKPFSDRKEKAFFVPKDEIVEQKYDLSINRYAEVKHIEVKYDKPKVILKKLRKLEKTIISDLDKLKGMIS